MSIRPTPVGSWQIFVTGAGSRLVVIFDAANQFRWIVDIVHITKMLDELLIPLSTYFGPAQRCDLTFFVSKCLT